MTAGGTNEWDKQGQSLFDPVGQVGTVPFCPKMKGENL